MHTNFLKRKFNITSIHACCPDTTLRAGCEPFMPGCTKGSSWVSGHTNFASHVHNCPCSVYEYIHTQLWNDDPCHNHPS